MRRKLQERLPAAVLSDNGEELWTATETNSSAGLAITGYKRRRNGNHVQWILSHSFSSVTGISREAHSHRVHLHILAATHSIAAVSCTGVVFILPTEEGSASPLRLLLVNFLILSSFVHEWLSMAGACCRAVHC